MSPTFRQLKKIHQKAYAAFDEGQLATAAIYFQKLCRYRPDVADFHYMRGLVAKNRMDWQMALSANLRAIELAYARRIDPVRAVILNVPFPESGWRCGDIVLHDGAPTGSRTDENGNEISVFNALERWQTSPKQTFTVFVQCESADDVRALLDCCHQQHNLDAEDWTENTRMICLQCSYGRVHKHHHNHKSADWQCERSIGIAANSLSKIEKVLNEWQGQNRKVLEICQQDYPIPTRKDGWVWWV